MRGLIGFPCSSTTLAYRREKELDQIIKGVITPLNDDATIVIAGGEVFISHERTGRAS